MDELELPAVRFGKMVNPDLPKSTPKWIWFCACDECEKLPFVERIMDAASRGRFRTMRDAQRDFEQHVTLLLAEPGGCA
jgi:hypothetical protein